MGKPLVVIAVRSNVNWLTMNKDKFFAQGQGTLRSKIFHQNWLDKHWKYIELWDSMLTVTYFQTRHKLQQLSEKAIADVRGVDLVIKGKAAMRQFTKDFKNDKWIILPIDDDDYFSPNIVSKVLRFYDNFDLIAWRTLMLNTTSAITIKQMADKKNLPSNSYAVTNKVGKKINSKALAEVIARHVSVKMLTVKKHKIQENLSIYNKNPTSFSGTRNKTINEDSMFKHFDRVRYGMKFGFTHELDWVYSYARGVQEVLKECL